MDTKIQPVISPPKRGSYCRRTAEFKRVIVVDHGTEPPTENVTRPKAADPATEGADSRDGPIAPGG